MSLITVVTHVEYGFETHQNPYAQIYNLGQKSWRELVIIVAQMTSPTSPTISVQS